MQKMAQTEISKSNWTGKLSKSNLTRTESDEQGIYLKFIVNVKTTNRHSLKTLNLDTFMDHTWIKINK